jgi:hypothetical protein
MSKYITLFVGISVVISLVYIAGYKKNIKIMKQMSESLERAFSPKDKLYTYLGGVLGFIAEYQIDGFEKISITLRLIPRQSALYLPFMFVTSGKDSLQIMFYTKKPVVSEFHIIKESPLKLTKPKIYNKDKLTSSKINIDGIKYEILKDSDRYEKFIDFMKLFNKNKFNHLAITKDNSIVYVNLLFYKMNYEELEESLKKAVNFLKTAI